MTVIHPEPGEATRETTTRERRSDMSSTAGVELGKEPAAQSAAGGVGAAGGDERGGLSKRRG